MAQRQPADHEQSQHHHGRGVELAGLVEAQVGLSQFLLGHADAVVGDAQQVAVVGVLADHRHRGGGRREGGGVLHELRQHVGDVGGYVAPHFHRLQGGDVDAVIRLDLGERPSNDVAHVHRLGPGAGGLGTGQDQQRLGVAAHAGDQVVQPEQVVQGLGVALGLFQGGDEVEGPVQQVLVASAQVDEHGGHALAQLGLACSQLHGVVTQGLEAGRELLDLFAAPNLHGWRFGQGGPHRQIPYRLHQLGQADGGSFVDRGGERAQRSTDGAGHERAGRGHQGHDGQTGEAQQHGLLPGQVVCCLFLALEV